MLAPLLGEPRLAPLYRTRAIAETPQPDYLNTVLVGRSTLEPEALLAVGKRLELAAGRRLGPRNAPRPLDVDLLLFGTRRTTLSELTLPHPRLRERRFYLEPLAALAPRLRVAPDQRTVAELLAAVGQREAVTRVAWSTPLDLRSGT